MRTKNIPVLNWAVQSFFPKLCICCGEAIDEQDELCANCHRLIERFDIEKRCVNCGLEKGNCDCNARVFYFSACCAPFHNLGLASRIMRGFKFLHREHYGRYLAQQMALTVRTEYSGIEFDGICYVPATRRITMKRGYNQSRVLAAHISSITGIPLFDNALKCRRKRSAQHTLSYKERFENVKDLYEWNYQNKGRTLLLVDDIKTTGATLNECARQLLLSGAEKVYCVTGLITKKPENEKKGGMENGNRNRN